MVTFSCNPRAQDIKYTCRGRDRWAPGDSLANQPSLLIQLQASERPCQENTNGIWGRIFSVVLWPPHASVHTWITTPTYTQAHTKYPPVRETQHYFSLVYEWAHGRQCAEMLFYIQYCVRLAIRSRTWTLTSDHAIVWTFVCIIYPIHWTQGQSAIISLLNIIVIF